MKSSLLFHSFLLLFVLHANALTTEVTSTFTTGIDGWEPDNPWTTSDVDGITPGNSYLRITPTGFGNRGSRMLTFNPTTDWTGDYFGNNIRGLQMNVVNRDIPGNDPLDLRIAIGNRANPQQSGGTWWTSKISTRIEVGTDWDTYVFSLEEVDLQRVGNLMGQLGTDSYADTFSNVLSIRILSSTTGLSPIGDQLIGDIGIDNITLVPESSHFAVLLGILSLPIALLRRKQ